MEDVTRDWLRWWHDILDEVSGPDPEFDFEEALESPDEDFRMHFVTWELPDEALLRCFSVLPQGETIGQRAVEMRKLLHDRSRSISQERAVELFQEGLTRYTKYSKEDDLKKAIQIKHVTSDTLIDAAMNADRVGIVFETVRFDQDPKAIVASSFLHETLYRLANSYEIADYISWPLFPDPESIDPHQTIAELVIDGKHFTLLDEKGPLLLILSD